MPSILKKRLYLILVILLIVLIDQSSKLILVSNIERLINRQFLFFTFNYVENYGAAFNILSGSRVLLSFVSLLSSLILFYLIIFKKNIGDVDRFSLAFILGGSLGNGIDRINNGYVVDFINLKFINFPIFNIADIAINLGFLFLLITIFRTDKN